MNSCSFDSSAEEFDGDSCARTGVSLVDVFELVWRKGVPIRTTAVPKDNAIFF